METTLQTNLGRYELQRLPKRRRERLRAWDAADEYLLDHLAGEWNATEPARILICNDSFGALAVSLHSHRPQAWSDSWLSHEATRMNLAANGLPTDSFEPVSSMELPQGPFDLVLIKAPKTLALLEDELIRLRPQLTPDSRLIVAGMIKGMSPRVWKLLERLIGPTRTSLARKKARMIFVTPEPALAPTVNPYPVIYHLEGSGYRISNHANVFSRDGLDIGTRFFLQHLPRQASARDIIDLGCGNGVVGMMSAEANPGATLHFVDESYMAVASARENFETAFGTGRTATFRVGDTLSGFEDASADLILCNPPFHQQGTVNDGIATEMFKQSRRVLRPGGELWVIGNRHLGYHVRLKRLFGNVELIASNRKFVILRSLASSGQR
jgi:16S rRNA (guanine1207-N2)-methyltransferase